VSHCPRCHGMLVSEQDESWAYWKCFQCGHRFDQHSRDNHYLHTQLATFTPSCSTSSQTPRRQTPSRLTRHRQGYNYGQSPDADQAK